MAVDADDNVIWLEDEIRPPRKLGCDAIFSGEQSGKENEIFIDCFTMNYK